MVSVVRFELSNVNGEWAIVNRKNGHKSQVLYLLLVAHYSLLITHY